MIYLLLLIPLAVVLIAALQPRHHWEDDGDIRGIVQHSVRVPSEIERHAMWWDKYYIRFESGVQHG